MGGLDGLFFPKGVCIVGASRDPQALGHIIFKNILAGGFSGEVYPVNPKCESLLGLKCYPSVRDLPTSPDLAIVAVPSTVVPTIIAECGEKGHPLCRHNNRWFQGDRREGIRARERST
ncbi:MAG: CoA-binding protein [Candidatus Methanomethylicaceae archaeon]